MLCFRVHRISAASLALISGALPLLRTMRSRKTHSISFQIFSSAHARTNSSALSPVQQVRHGRQCHSSERRARHLHTGDRRRSGRVRCWYVRRQCQLLLGSAEGGQRPESAVHRRDVCGQRERRPRLHAGFDVALRDARLLAGDCCVRGQR